MFSDREIEIIIDCVDIEMTTTGRGCVKYNQLRSIRRKLTAIENARSDNLGQKTTKIRHRRNETPLPQRLHSTRSSGRNRSITADGSTQIQKRQFPTQAECFCIR